MVVDCVLTRDGGIGLPIQNAFRFADTGAALRPAHTHTHKKKPKETEVPCFKKQPKGGGAGDHHTGRRR